MFAVGSARSHLRLSANWQSDAGSCSRRRRRKARNSAPPRVHARHAILDAADVHITAAEVDRIPF
jgi:hypothetical protein